MSFTFSMTFAFSVSMPFRFSRAMPVPSEVKRQFGAPYASPERLLVLCDRGQRVDRHRALVIFRHFPLKDGRFRLVVRVFMGESVVACFAIAVDPFGDVVVFPHSHYLVRGRISRL